jgi:hypothetical protein
MIAEIEMLVEGWKTGRNHTSHTRASRCMLLVSIVRIISPAALVLLLLSISSHLTKISMLKHVSSFIFFHFQYGMRICILQHPTLYPAPQYQQPAPA